MNDKPPRTIYLQWHGPQDPEFGVTWCVDKINDDDVAYVNFEEILPRLQSAQEMYTTACGMMDAAAHMWQDVPAQKIVSGWFVMFLAEISAKSAMAQQAVYQTVNQMFKDVIIRNLVNDEVQRITKEIRKKNDQAQ